jgi:tetratricopeptide (TPR) repeat protein
MKLATTNAPFVAAVVFSFSLLLAPSHPSFAQPPSAQNAQQPPTQKQESSTQKQQIYNLLAAHRFPEAEQAAGAYLALTPDDCSVNLLLGLALRGENKLEPAFKAFHTAMSQCPANIAAIEGAAETAFLLNNPEAKSLVTQVIKLRPTEETGYAMLGAIDARTGDCPGAVENYAKAPTRVAGNAAALRQYAGCLVSLGRPAEAVPLLSRLLALQDKSANRIALARAQAAAKDRPAALATLQPLLSAASQNNAARDSTAFLLAAELAEADNQTPQAVEWFRKAIEINPRDATAYLAFAEMSFNHGAFKVGSDFLTLGIQELPSEARLYLARGVLEEQMTQMDAALRDFEEAHRLDPKLSFAEDAMGMLFSQKHDTAAALTLFAQQSQLHPNDPLLQYLYAEALSQVENPDEKLTEKAIATAQRAVQLEPGYQPARDLLCVLLLRHNDLPGVIAQAEEARRRDPYDEVALYQEMLAERKLNHPDKTAALVKEFQAAKAHNQEARTKYILQEAPSPQ